jgi:hypothetical protein
MAVGHHFVPHGFTQTAQTASHFFIFKPQPQSLTRYYARDEVLMAMTINICIFWDVTPCFGETFCLHVQDKRLSALENRVLPGKGGWIRHCSRFSCGD